MDKRQRHNLLLILAIIILLLGVGSQVYLMVKSGEGTDNQPAVETPGQQQ
jgi:flagellar basal body-associated protein FliL